MFYEQDWIMQQIQMLVQFIARTVFKKDTISYEIIDETNLSEADLLYKRLKSLIAERRICDAENLLFENIHEDNTEYLEVALDFYQTINLMTDDVLEAHNFSRQEIDDGMHEIMRKYHISELEI